MYHHHDNPSSTSLIGYSRRRITWAQVACLAALVACLGFWVF